MSATKSDLMHVARVAEYSARILSAERTSRKALSPAERNRALGWYRIERARLEGIAFEVRRAIQDAYTLAASRVGVDPAALQALVWTARVGFGGEYGPSEPAVIGSLS